MLLTNPKHFEEVIKPYNSMRQQPVSYDLQLDSHIRLEDGRIRKLSEDPYIYPKEFLLASTVEFVRIPEGMCGIVVGKSTNARLGLSIENAGLIDPGFDGTVTLELFNMSSYPINLKQLISIAQLELETTELGGKLYNGHYQGQVGATPAWKDARKKDVENTNGKKLALEDLSQKIKINAEEPEVVMKFKASEYVKLDNEITKLVFENNEEIDDLLTSFIEDHLSEEDIQYFRYYYISEWKKRIDEVFKGMKRETEKE